MSVITPRAAATAFCASAGSRRGPAPVDAPPTPPTAAAADGAGGAVVAPGLAVDDVGVLPVAVAAPAFMDDEVDALSATLTAPDFVDGADAFAEPGVRGGSDAAPPAIAFPLAARGIVALAAPIVPSTGADW